MLFKKSIKTNMNLRGCHSHKKKHPWDRVHLSKLDRKGKSYEEIQFLRFQKWLRQYM